MRVLIRRLSRENVLWSAETIHGHLVLLGYDPCLPERDWAYAKRKLSQGYDPEEVIQAIRDYRPDKHNPERYARYTVEKAQAELHSADSSHEESRTPVDR